MTTADRSGEELKTNAFVLCLFHFGSYGRHLGFTSPIDDGGSHTQAQQRARNIDRSVSTADDRNRRRKLWALPGKNSLQQLNSVVDMPMIASGHYKTPRFMQSDGYDHRVESASDIFKPDVAPDANVLGELDAGPLDELDLSVKYLLRQTVVGDAGAQVSSCLRLVIENCYVVSLECQPVRGRDPRRPRADHRNLLAAPRRGLRSSPVGKQKITQKPLDHVHRNGAAERVAITRGLAKMRTDSAESCREGIRRAQKPRGPRKIAAGHPQNHGGNIVPRRARLRARWKLVFVTRLHVFPRAGIDFARRTCGVGRDREISKNLWLGRGHLSSLHCSNRLRGPWRLGARAEARI